MEKQRGTLLKWNDTRGFGFVASRGEDGVRRTYFLHASRIIFIEGGGVPELNSDLVFNLEQSERGAMAVDCEIFSFKAKVAAGRVARALASGAIAAKDGGN